MALPAAQQRFLPIATGERTYAHRHQAGVRCDHRRWPKRQPYDVQLTPDYDWLGLSARTTASVPRELTVGVEMTAAFEAFMTA